MFSLFGTTNIETPFLSEHRFNERNVIGSNYWQFSWRSVNSEMSFWCLQFFQKTNENNSTWGTIVYLVMSNFFVRFLEELKTPKRHFEISWHLLRLTIYFARFSSKKCQFKDKPYIFSCNHNWNENTSLMDNPVTVVFTVSILEILTCTAVVVTLKGDRIRLTNVCQQN